MSASKICHKTPLINSYFFDAASFAHCQNFSAAGLSRPFSAAIYWDVCGIVALNSTTLLIMPSGHLLTVRLERFSCAFAELFRGRAESSSARKNSKRDPLRLRGETQKFYAITECISERV